VVFIWGPIILNCPTQPHGKNLPGTGSAQLEVEGRVVTGKLIKTSGRDAKNPMVFLKSKQPSCIFLFRNSCCQFRIESDGSQQLFEWGITPLFVMLLK